MLTSLLTIDMMMLKASTFILGVKGWVEIFICFALLCNEPLLDRKDWGHQMWFPGLSVLSVFLSPAPASPLTVQQLTLCLWPLARPPQGPSEPGSTETRPLLVLVTARPPKYTPSPIPLISVTKDTSEKMVGCYRSSSPGHHSLHCHSRANHQMAWGRLFGK